MPEAFPDPLFSQLHATGVVAVLMLDDAEHAVPVAEALIAGGVTAMELTLRTPAAMEALKRIRASVPAMTVGVGTILTTDQVHAVRYAGAAFGVAPGMNPRVVAEAVKIGLPFAPGICTPSDIEQALEQGCKLLKFFPAEPCGGLSYLKNIAAPYAHLGLRYIPLGGVNEANAGAYLKEPIIQAIGGSWIAPREVIQAKDWAAITQNARMAAGVARHFR